MKIYIYIHTYTRKLRETVLYYAGRIPSAAQWHRGDGRPASYVGTVAVVGHIVGWYIHSSVFSEFFLRNKKN